MPCLIVLQIFSPFAAVAGDGLNWSVTPYLWATETRYKLKADGTPIGDGKITFDDLVDTSDASFQFVTEAAIKGGKWSAFADVTYLDTSDTCKGDILRVDSDSESWVVDAAIAWWPGGEEQYGLMFGYRCKEAEFKHGKLEEKNKYYGPLLGFNFRF